MNQPPAAPGFGPLGVHPRAFGPSKGLRAPLALDAHVTRRLAAGCLLLLRKSATAACDPLLPFTKDSYRPEAVTPQHRDLSNPVAFIINKQLAIFFGKSPELLLRQQIKYLL